MSDPKTHEERLAAVRKARTDREASLVRAAEEREIQEGELEDKLSAELGIRGKDFEIIDAEHWGLIAVKRVNLLVTRAWDQACAKSAKSGGVPGVSDFLAYTLPGVVFPEPAKFKAMVLGTEESPGADGLATLAAGAIQALHANLKAGANQKR